MKINVIDGEFSVCRVDTFDAAMLGRDYCFLGKTPGERSLVCRTADVPPDALLREDGWRAFFLDGVLDFSLVGILADITARLAAEKISVFAVSTYDTDYVLLKKEDLGKALSALRDAGYEVG